MINFIEEGSHISLWSDGRRGRHAQEEIGADTPFLSLSFRVWQRTILTQAAVSDTNDYGTPQIAVTVKVPLLVLPTANAVTSQVVIPIGTLPTIMTPPLSDGFGSVTSPPPATTTPPGGHVTSAVRTCRTTRCTRRTSRSSRAYDPDTLRSCLTRWSCVASRTARPWYALDSLRTNSSLTTLMPRWTWWTYRTYDPLRTYWTYRTLWS
jgi:hypothetical protein